MRKIILALVATATLGCVSAEAMPAVGTDAVAPVIQQNSAIQKTEVVVVKRRRPAVVVRRRPPVVVVKRRRPAIVIH